MKSIKGHIVDIENRKIFPGEISIMDGKIVAIQPALEVPEQYIMPGFIDAHIHIESSMVVPYEFARVALSHGTIATVSDPHEIANVLGIEGVQYMIDNARNAGLKFHFGAPSCVPATSFETAGAVIESNAVKELLELDNIYYLSEMMNYPGVLNGDEEVLRKIQYAKDLGKPVDGHAPGLRGEKAAKYVAAGISTDHECFTLDEALDKLNFGMKVIIREGSAAKNFDALHIIIKSHPDQVMFCSDDKHPDDLMIGHINQLVVRALLLGYDLFDVLRIACINPVEHYRLRSGILKVEDPGDFIVVKNLETFEVIKTVVDGEVIFEQTKCHLPAKCHQVINQFNIDKKKKEDFRISGRKSEWPIIRAIDGELITEKLFTELPEINGNATVDLKRDILKIAVVNRYSESAVSCGFIQGFGIKKGAIASTVAHDSHNIIAIGTDDDTICAAVNLLIDSKGGLAAVSKESAMHIALPIAGLMSDQSCEVIGSQYSRIDSFVKEMGCALHAPFMTLSFMALLVIPKIKLSDQGIFDAETFEFYQ